MRKIDILRRGLPYIFAMVFSFSKAVVCPLYSKETQAPLTPSLTESYQTDLMTGQAVVDIPIVVPPGRQNIQPEIILRYASNQANGVCGVGWRLELGRITRDTKKGVPKYDSTDSFVANIGGATIELVDIGGGEYRAKQEGAFLKFSFDGTNWQVRDKRGTIYFFGSTTDSRQEDSARIFSWFLDKVVDLHGNYMTITYFQEEGEVYPQLIQYTGKEGKDTPTNTVEFIYEGREDILSNYRANFEIRTVRRLSAIDIKANGERARKYLLTYEYSPATGRSLLVSITQYGADGVTALPPITFEYQQGGTIGQ
jgi:hypothetical protein